MDIEEQNVEQQNTDVENTEQQVEQPESLDDAISAALSEAGVDFEKTPEEEAAIEDETKKLQEQEQRQQQLQQLQQIDPQIDQTQQQQPVAHKPLTEDELKIPEAFLAENASPEYKAFGEQFNKIQNAYRQSRMEVTDISNKMQAAEPDLRFAKNMHKAFDQTGMTHDQMQAYLNLAKYINTGTRESMQNARAMAVNLLSGIDTMLGNVGPGSVNQMEQHPDLLQAVENEEMSEEWAQKIAIQRARDAMMQNNFQQQQQYNQQQQYEQQENAAFTKAETNLNQLDVHLMKTDALYPALRPGLHNFVGELIAKGVHPNELVDAAISHYRSLHAGLVGTLPPAKNHNPQHQLLRPGATTNAAGFGNQIRLEPKTMMEAIDNALMDAGLAH